MQLKVGDIVEGKVTGITHFGAFIEIERGTTGMVYISEISKNFVKDIKDYLKIGDVVKSKVINISDKGEIGLSIKKLEESNAPKNDFKRNDRRIGKFSSKTCKKEPEKVSFEDMLSMFKAKSEEKMSDLKRATESKRGGYSRRGSSAKSR